MFCVEVLLPFVSYEKRLCIAPSDFVDCVQAGVLVRTFILTVTGHSEHDVVCYLFKGARVELVVLLFLFVVAVYLYMCARTTRRRRYCMLIPLQRPKSL